MAERTHCVLSLGKILDYRLSEVRIGELLDTLCTAVSSRFQLAVNNTGDAAEWGWTDGAPPLTAEGQHHSKELENFCIQLVDDYEEVLVEALRSEEGVHQEELHRILCLQSKACAALQSRTEL